MRFGDRVTCPLDYVSAVVSKVFVGDCFLAGYELEEDDSETVDVTFVCQLLGDVIPA